MHSHRAVLLLVASFAWACGGTVETPNEGSDSGIGGSGGGTGGGDVGGGGTGGGEVGGGGTGGSADCASEGPPLCNDDCVGMYPPQCINGSWQCMGAPGASMDCVDCLGSFTSPVCHNGAYTCESHTCVDAGATCPGLPSCNWCDGVDVFDADGCVVGYRCWNGVDPCQTDPCENEADCANMQEHCSNGLCSTTGPVSCSQSCGYDSDGTDVCEWDACSDGNTYASNCTLLPNGIWECECVVDSEPTSTCYWNNQGGAGGPSDYGNVCCPFPWP